MTRLFEAKPFIIAEVGSNWRTLDDCLESIRVAKECGADAVKFQVFDWPDLYGFNPLARRADMIEILGYLPDLKAQADASEIELMCTAFSPELVAAVDPYVTVHKVASSDAAWPQLLRAVRDTGKPVLISFGAKSEREQVGAAVTFMDNPYNGFALYCVAAYPADYVDFDEMERLKGFSDHTLGYTAAVEAAKRGIRVIEKHFTAFPGLDTPDRPHSLTPAQFTRMVKLIRGEPVETEESAMYLRYNRRLIATRDINVGEVLKYGENYGAYRSLKDDTRGLSPFDWEKVEGKAAQKEIQRGDSIGEGDFS